MELTFDQYKQQCKKIDKKFDQKLKSLVLSATEDNVSKSINKIEKKLQDYGKIIETEKNVFFYTVKQKYNISDELWNGIVKITEELQKIREQKMWEPCSNVVHDSALPQWFVAILKRKLVEVGLNQQGINIKGTDEQSFFTIVGYDIHWQYSVDNDLLSIKDSKFGTIIINSKMPNVSNLDIEEGRCLWIAQSIKMCHSLNVLDVMARFDIKIKKEEINLLSKLSFLQHLLNVALKNARSAHCIKLFCKQLIPGACSIENYKKVSKIDFCWKALDWLKKYYTFNYHNVPLLLEVKNCFEQDKISVFLDKGMVVTKNVINEAKNEDYKLLLQNAYDAQKCCVCFEHPEDMRDMPCNNEHVDNFICRECYNQLRCNNFNERKCPLCNSICFSYNKVAYY